MCPSTVEKEDIFISCDPNKVSRDIELFFNAAQKLNSMMSCDVIVYVSYMGYPVTSYPIILIS